MRGGERGEGRGGEGRGGIKWSGEGRRWRRGEKNEAHSHFDQGNQCGCVGQ